MAERFLVQVDLDSVQSSTSEGLDLKTISYLGRVQIKITPKNFALAKDFLKKHFNDFTTYCDANELEDRFGDIISLLDHGAMKVFVTQFQFDAIAKEKLLGDFSRLIVSLDHPARLNDISNAIRQAKEYIRGVVGDATVGIAIPDVHEDVAKDSGYPTTYITIANAQNTLDLYKKALISGHVPIIPAKELTIDQQKDPLKIPAWLLITTAIKTDRPDSLFATVVTNEHGICLGLVYSSDLSVAAALKSGNGVYWSRSRNKLWIKGAESGDTQDLISIGWDCDSDALQFTVRQHGNGFCHLKSPTCFGDYSGLARLEKTLDRRKGSAPEGSYTARLFKDPRLLEAKIMEEAGELCEATSKEDVAAEAADLFYFAMARCAAMGVNLEDIEKNLDLKSVKTSRRRGDAKPQWAAKVGLQNGIPTLATSRTPEGNDKLPQEALKEAASQPKSKDDLAGTVAGRIQMRKVRVADSDLSTLKAVLQRPSQRATDEIMNIVKPIIMEVRDRGDAAVLQYTHNFEKATSLTSPVLQAPFAPSLMKLPPETIEAIDVSFENIRRFHAAQQDEAPLRVETMPGVLCSRFSRPIERVGLYVPGGTAVLPSTALMLGVPAMVAGCKTIVLASPPRSDGTITPEIVYVAHKVGAESIVLAGGAQAVAALAYGTESITKVDKILGPGNQFVTAGKMVVSNDTTAGVSIDMPAGPSEVLVIADRTANPAFVASDLLSQAEHGTDSQVVLIAVDLSEEQLDNIEAELHTQANALPRVDIVRGAIEHSVTLTVDSIEEAIRLSNQYAPEHLILQVENADALVDRIQNAGSVFIGPWTPESVGDYSAGVNHSLPTYGYAKQYSGVNLASFTKYITSSTLTKEGLKNVSGAVMQLAKVEQLDAHRRAVDVRLKHMAG
ncbi:MAG: hypothetical protein Q9191_000055 [Dirinaria sp. TL-2023a]